MEIKTILCLILHAHTCSAIFNGSAQHSLVETATTVKPVHPDNHQPKRGPSGRSFTVSVSHNDEPIDKIDEPDSTSSPNKSCKGSAQHSLVETATTVKPVHPDNHQPKRGPSGRSFTVSVSHNDEPIDKIDEPDSTSNPNKSCKGIIFLSFAIHPEDTHPEDTHPEDTHPEDTHPCNGTDLTTEKSNGISFKVSNESAGFLKGLMFTRVMPSFYILIVLISLPLNALALVMFTCRIREKKPAAIYMCHLACVDLLFTLLLPLKIHYQVNGAHWVFGEVACRVLTAAYYCYMYCSILLMMCMSVDRLLAVGFPVASLTWRSVRKASFICTLVWLLALTGTVPLLSLRQTFKIENVGVTCYDALIYTPADQLYIYLFSILSCLYYFVPLIVTIVSYFTIIYVLRAKSNRLSKSPSWLEKRKRATSMLIAMLIEFVVCFAPTNGILLYHCIRLATGGNSGEGDSSYAAYLLAVCLGSASVFLDPLLYYYGSSQCRQKISSLFWWRKATTSISRSNTQSGSSFVSIEYTKVGVKI